MVLCQDDDVLGRLAALMRNEQIPSASITGFGFAATARFGFFDFVQGDYDPREVKQLEITSFTGTLAWRDDEPAIHAHAAGANRNLGVVGGHVLGLVVGRGSFEITVMVHSQRLQRRIEPELGAQVLQLGNDAHGLGA